MTVCHGGGKAREDTPLVRKKKMPQRNTRAVKKQGRRQTPQMTKRHGRILSFLFRCEFGVQGGTREPRCRGTAKTRGALPDGTGGTGCCPYHEGRKRGEIRNRG